MTKPKRYHPLLVTLHWLTALLVFILLGGGKAVLLMMPNTAEKIIPLTLHVTTGLIALVVLVLRLAVRLLTSKPEPASTGNPILDKIGVLTHYLLYIAVFGMVISGLGMAVISGLFGVLYQNTGSLPADFWVYPPRIAHGITASALIGLLALHIGAALFHQFIRKDGLFSRMWFGKE